MRKSIIITISNMTEDLGHGEHIFTYELERNNLPKLKRDLKQLFKQDRQKTLEKEGSLK